MCLTCVTGVVCDDKDWLQDRGVRVFWQYGSTVAIEEWFRDVCVFQCGVNIYVTVSRDKNMIIWSRSERCAMRQREYSTPRLLNKSIYISDCTSVAICSYSVCWSPVQVHPTPFELYSWISLLKSDSNPIKITPLQSIRIKLYFYLNKIQELPCQFLLIWLRFYFYNSSHSSVCWPCSKVA